MKIIVLGAGLIGVATAYYLWRDGHEIEVIEREAEAASATSYANACLISASRALPWPNPGSRGTLWRSLTDADAPMRVTRWLDPALWRWGREFMSYANEQEFARLTGAKLAFARFCQDELEAALAATGVECGYRRDGLLYVCRSDATLAAARARAALVGAHGYEARVLGRESAIALESSLAASTVVGGTLAVSDAQGDSRAFTRALARWLASRPERPVRFRMGETVRATPLQRLRSFELSTAAGKLDADAFVVALGPQTAAFGRAMGRRVPMYPVKGFSLTVPVRDTTKAPTRGGICEDSLIAWCPLTTAQGPAMRITTGAVFCGDDNGYRDADFVAHRRHFDALFPGALAWEHPSVECWACQRPMTPSTLPIIQRDPTHANLYWNCGQGHIGWTMSCGSGRVLADVVAGRAPAFTTADFQQL
ncbi:MAG: FAD-dependent oxidoreductase [Burkholderiales bacterium]|nr:FAD-dependent oxidoreductase [Burkholderiales bacterium]